MAGESRSRLRFWIRTFSEAIVDREACTTEAAMASRGAVCRTERIT